MKDFITTKDLGPSALKELIDQASDLRDGLDRGVPPSADLEGRCIASLFFEPSTRTRLSFELAAQRLGAHVITFNPATSSAAKGESLRDTVLTVSAMGADILVVRHVDEGVPQSVSEWTGLAVVNAGDGMNEHPTQALVDAVTLHRHFGDLAGLRLGVVGDVTHSRVMGSLVHVLPQMGVEMTLVGPPQWLPRETSLRTSIAIDDVLPGLDVIYLLRVQTERGGRITDSYIGNYQLDRQRLTRMQEHAIVMHPGPMNRGVEISDEVADSPRSHVVEQVRNGVPARMAVLRALGGVS